MGFKLDGQQSDWLCRHSVLLDSGLEWFRWSGGTPFGLVLQNLICICVNLGTGSNHLSNQAIDQTDYSGIIPRQLRSDANRIMLMYIIRVLLSCDSIESILSLVIDAILSMNTLSGSDWLNLGHIKILKGFGFIPLKMMFCSWRLASYVCPLPDTTNYRQSSAITGTQLAF